MKVFHFLGGLYFAIFLISTVAVLVVAGTVIESITDSHRFAEIFTYGNPLFNAILWGIFINILFSSLRRWPFQKRHIPFLLTHLGLLMILGGALIKSYAGLQGTMVVLEGSGSQEVVIPNTYAIELESHGKKWQWKLKENYWSKPELISDNTGFSPELRLLHYSPHSTTHPETWIKEDHAIISGLAPIALKKWDLEKSLPEGFPVRLHKNYSHLWKTAAIQTELVDKAEEAAWIQHTKLKLSETKTKSLIAEVPMKEALDHGVKWLEGEANVTLVWEDKHPFVVINSNGEEVIVSLDGPEALLNRNMTSSFTGKSPILVDFISEPYLLFIKDKAEETCLYCHNPHGHIYRKHFNKDSLQSIIVYEDGYSGYAVQEELPFPQYSAGRVEREDAALTLLKKELNNRGTTPLCPPLEVFENACKQADIDFSETFVGYLDRWNHSRAWLCTNCADLDKVLGAVTCADIDLAAVFWISIFFSDMDQRLLNGESFLTILKEKRWPLINDIEESKDQELGVQMTLVARQLYEAVLQDPIAMQVPTDISMNAQLMSAWLRIYGIHLSTLVPPAKEDAWNQRLSDYHEIAAEFPLIETPLTFKHVPEKAETKLENNRPLVVLQLIEDKQSQIFALAYDPNKASLQLPVLQGRYLARFQPQTVEIPFRVRLRDARQICYQESTQPFSYESDILVTDLRDGTILEKTLSMNDVHETWDGYRFYLATISPPEEIAAQSSGIAVNHDPAKYLLTYPGGIIMTIGIILLFWIFPYLKKKKQ